MKKEEIEENEEKKEKIIRMIQMKILVFKMIII